MKIIQINVVYKKGSTGKIVYDIHQILKVSSKYTSIIYYGKGRKDKERGVNKIAPELLTKLQSLRSRITGYAYSGCYITTRLLIKSIEREKPDIVHLHCINGYFVNIYKLLEYLKMNNIKTLITLHAEFMYTAGCGYSIDCEKWKRGCSECPQLNKQRPKSWFFDRSKEEWRLMKKAYADFNRLYIVSVSDWVYERAIQSPFFDKKKMDIIYNGINTDTFKPVDFSDIKKKHQIKSEKVVLFVTPDFDAQIKGGIYLVDIAKRLLNENVVFIIVGVKNDEYKFPPNIIAIKHTEDQKELAKYYSMANITLLTSKRETFSMVTAESLSCGTPVVGFKAGAPEMIALKKHSEFVEFGNIDLLEEKVREWLFDKQIVRAEIIEEAKVKYSKLTMARKYCEIYEKDY